jgi:hypothetical protein
LKNFPKTPVVSTDYTSEMIRARIEPKEETGGYFFRADSQGISASYSLFFTRFASEIDVPVSKRFHASPNPLQQKQPGM